MHVKLLQSNFKQLIIVLADLIPLADCLAESFKNFLEANRVRTKEYSNPCSYFEIKSRSRSEELESG